MKNYILIILFIGLSSAVHAQPQGDEEIVKTQSVNGLYVAFVPSALINPWTGYQAKVNYGLFNLIQLQINGGLLYGKRSDYRFSGYRIRPCVKFFLPIGIEAYDRFFIGVEYNVRKIKEKGEANYARFGGAFIEELPFERIKKSQSFIFSFGARIQVDKLFFIESGIGCGAGPIKVTTTKHENSDLFPDQLFFRRYQEEGEYSMLNVLIHISIGVKLF